ncbi:metallophosphoesterase [Sporosarcina sp. Sa2YVA2]|uniref:Metallophosphoesterase n=1 Tax=Sporosarcina quadrami TaxID=2762234 RepID=A0ABR8UDX4_9BACL|nr:metallophosphoesterase [Sporosarcina quadrami]MBD7986242.1 metallophosphoesterase [Sporosarcina quadrami]
MLTIQHVALEKGKRVIITSDIHANLPLFKRLLEKVGYSTEDYLFIVGDLCEKGPDSLGTIAFTRELAGASDRVFISKGNCDVLHRYVFNNVESIWNYIEKQRYSVLNEMLVAHDKRTEDFETLAELGLFYRENFGDELEWLEHLPVGFETDDFILIHAGIEDIGDWRQTEEQFALSVPSFGEKGHQADKTVIVGHWPTVNYRAAAESSNNPFIDYKKKIISIDGGNCIKRDGQLNALIVEGDELSYIFVDDLEERIVTTDHTDDTGRIGTVTYPNYEVDVLQVDTHFSLCLNRSLGIEQWVKNEFIQDGICSGDSSTTFLSVRKGETVSIVLDSFDGYMLVKKRDGTVGWIPKG